mgnify:CR=1 FL=1
MQFIKNEKNSIENNKNKDIINVSIDTFDKDEVTDISEVIRICERISNERIEINQDYYKNLIFSTDYGYTPDDMREVIHSLTKFDLYKGPEKDRNPNYKHPFWIFIKYLPDIDCNVYIKLKIVNHKLKVNVFRFHEEGMYDEDF